MCPPLTSPRFAGNARLRLAANNSPPMRKWDRDREAVKIIQQALRDLPGGRYPQRESFRKGADGVFRPDGIYGDHTVITVRQFQIDQLFALEDRTGFVGHKTLCKLDDLFAQSTALPPPPVPATPHTTLPDSLRRLSDAILADPPVGQGQSKPYGPADRVHVVMLHDSCGMKILVRGPTALHTISGAVEDDLQVRSGVAISGSFGAFIIDRRTTGIVLQNGRPTNGSSFRNAAFLSFAGGGHHVFGLGNPPPTHASRLVLYALGGLIPLILDGGAITNNDWYNLNNEVTGRCIVAHKRSTRQLAVIVQHHASPSFNLDDFRDFVLAIGCDDAVGLDGSTSAMLRHRNEWVVHNTRDKDHRNENAVGFYGFS